MAYFNAPKNPFIDVALTLYLVACERALKYEPSVFPSKFAPAIACHSRFKLAFSVPPLMISSSVTLFTAVCALFDACCASSAADCAAFAAAFASSAAPFASFTPNPNASNCLSAVIVSDALNLMLPIISAPFLAMMRGGLELISIISCRVGSCSCSVVIVPPAI